MSIHKTARTSAFGAEPGLPTYRLRQARYKELAQDIGQLALKNLERTGRRLQVLDVGVADGVSRRYVELEQGTEWVDYHGVDMVIPRPEQVYKGHDWRFFQANLEHGMPDVPANTFDVVICEQVLEHLHRIELAVEDLIRVTRPGGTLFVGVPIFPPGLVLLRRHLIPRFDQWMGRKEPRSHIQAFTRRSFIAALNRSGQLQIEQQRGFRIISGGLLRPLEYVRWWWRLNRRIGSIIPGACIEVQAVARKLPLDDELSATPLHHHSESRLPKANTRNAA